MRERERKPSVPILLIMAGAFFVVAALFFKGMQRPVFMYTSALVAVALISTGIIDLIRKYRN